MIRITTTILWITQVCILLLFVGKLGAWTLPYDDPGVYPNAGNWDTQLQDTWEGYKEGYIDAYSGHGCYGLVYDPSPDGNHAVSEGVGYGLLMAVFMNDQSYFNLIFDAAENLMWNEVEGVYDWERDIEGNPKHGDYSNGGATDADEDICLALIFADKLVQFEYWESGHVSPVTGETYGEKAQTLINNIYDYEVEDGRYLKPGNRWGGAGTMNPSYFAPAWYRIFDAYENTDHDWATVIDQCYTTLESVHPGGTDGYYYGLAPDWCTSDGNIANDPPRTSGPSGKGYDMWYDAIRVPWRIALDYIWYHEPRALEYCNYGMDFVSADICIMYNMDGTAYEPDDGAWHNELTVGMWAAGSMGSNNTAQQAAFNTEMEDYDNFTPLGYWGDWDDAQIYYYNQSLAWFGAAVLGGNFPNVFSDLIPGDVSGDGQITAYDACLVIRYVVGLVDLEVEQQKAADVTNDGKITAMDAALILQYTVGLITQFPAIGAPILVAKDYNQFLTKIIAELENSSLSPEQKQVLEQLKCILWRQESPKQTALLQNYPNPFNPETWIPFELSQSTPVIINIYDVRSQLIRTIALGNRSPGIYVSKEKAAYWNGRDSLGEKVASGVYFYTLQAGDFSATRKMVIIK